MLAVGHADTVAVVNLVRDHAIRQRLYEQALDGALQRAWLHT